MNSHYGYGSIDIDDDDNVQSVTPRLLREERRSDSTIFDFVIEDGNLRLSTCVNSMLGFSKIARIQGLLQTQATILLVRNYHKQPVEVVWKKPEIGWTKLNFDGSRGREGQASIGGIFRNHKAEFLLGYSESIGEATSTVAEFVALKRGLELILENGWTDVWLEGDAKIIVDIIAKRGRLRCEEAKKHANYINVVIPGLSNCILSHVYREGNRVADKLAKLGHRYQEPKVWKVQPPEIVLPIMHEDAEGKIVLRTK